MTFASSAFANTAFQVDDVAPPVPREKLGLPRARRPYNFRDRQYDLTQPKIVDWKEAATARRDMIEKSIRNVLHPEKEIKTEPANLRPLRYDGKIEVKEDNYELEIMLLSTYL